MTHDNTEATRDRSRGRRRARISKYPTLSTLPNSAVIESVPVSSLRAYKRRLRKHDSTQIEHMKESLQAFGQVLPILIDDDGEIIDGHLLYNTLVALGYAHVLVIRLSHLTGDQVRKLRLSLNKIAEGAKWDVDELRLEVGELCVISTDEEFSIPGFEVAELDLLLSPDTKHRQVDEDDQIPAHDQSRRTISREGDIWLLGPHRLLCGDARNTTCFETLMRGEVAALVQSDLPYNVPITGHVSGLGKAKHQDFAMAAGEMSPAEFTSFLEATVSDATRHLQPGAILQLFMDWRHMSELLTAAEACGLEFINLCVWVKDNGGMGSLYRSRHELVFIFRKPGASHRNNVQLGRFGRYRTNVWEYPGMNSMQEGRDELLALHPTVKPVALIADAICDSTKRGDVVLDPFAGSGTTFIAASRTGRRACGIEIDPIYCDVAVERWERATGGTARHETTGLTRNELAGQRRRTRNRTRKRKETSA